MEKNSPCSKGALSQDNYWFPLVRTSYLWCLLHPPLLVQQGPPVFLLTEGPPFWVQEVVQLHKITLPPSYHHKNIPSHPLYFFHILLHILTKLARGLGLSGVGKFILGLLGLHYKSVRRHLLNRIVGHGLWYVQGSRWVSIGGHREWKCLLYVFPSSRVFQGLRAGRCHML